MTPYRTSGRPTRDEPPRDPVPDDDRIILWVALVVSLLGLVPKLIAGGTWGAEPTVALLIVLTSTFLLIRRRKR